jgi:hypothetical protein
MNKKMNISMNMTIDMDMNTNMDKGANTDTKMTLKDLDSDISYRLKV